MDWNGISKFILKCSSYKNNNNCKNDNYGYKNVNSLWICKNICNMLYECSKYNLWWRVSLENQIECKIIQILLILLNEKSVIYEKPLNLLKFSLHELTSSTE